MEIATIQAMMKRLLSSFLCVLFLFTSPLWARAAALPEQAFVSGVTGHAQSYGLSCESRSAADVAAFWGASVSETEILNALPRSDDPEIGFVGDVNGAWGYVPPQAYGVHAQPIAKVLQQYGLDAEARQNMTWEEAQAEIAAGRPLIVWLIGAVWSGTPQVYTTLAGKQVTVAAFEHTMTLIGYEAQNVTLINAGDGKTGVYPLSNFLNSWSVLNNMAVVVRGKQQQTPGGFTTLTATVVLPKETPPVPQASATSPVPDPTQMTPVAPTIAYTVLPGDTLADIAQRFGTTAEIIAELNQLAFPYVIFSGQVLQIPQGGSSFATPTVVSPETPAAVESPPFENTPATALPGETLAAPREMQIYVVQAGDTLATVARRWKMTWIELARWNNLAYPYQLTEGQILKVP